MACHLLDGHQGCRDAPNDSAMDRLYSNSSFRLIDVEENCIVPAKGQPFFALSYVWGQDLRTYRASMGNVNNLTQPGSLNPATSKLPRIVEDAMHLTNLLDYKYLWVDAFCIDQADPEDLRRNISTMDAVYTLTTLTICAADRDSNSGIRGFTRGSRNFQQTTVRYSDDVQLMVTRSAEYFVERSR